MFGSFVIVLLFYFLEINRFIRGMGNESILTSVDWRPWIIMSDTFIELLPCDRRYPFNTVSGGISWLMVKQVKLNQIKSVMSLSVSTTHHTGQQCSISVLEYDPWEHIPYHTTRYSSVMLGDNPRNPTAVYSWLRLHCTLSLIWTSHFFYLQLLALYFVSNAEEYEDKIIVGIRAITPCPILLNSV